MSKTLFNHLTAIFENQDPAYFDELDEADKKSYSTYMINRLISMNAKYLPLVNEIQKYPLTPRESYLFYSQALPKGRQFNKYIKGEKETAYDEWVVEIVARYYTIGQRDAIEYLDLMMSKDDGKMALRQICEFFGTDPKDIKKLKL